MPVNQKLQIQPTANGFRQLTKHTNLKHHEALKLFFIFNFDHRGLTGM